MSNSSLIGLSTTVSDPCKDYLNDAHNNQVVTMCEKSYAREDSSDGSMSVDSVVLRVMKQQENCKCHVSFIDQTEQVSISVRPYEGYTNAVPNHQNCGLAIVIQSKTTELFTIQCSGIFNKQLAFLKNGEALELTPRIIDGNFTRGYCLQFYRVFDVHKNFHLQIECYKKDMSTDAVLDINLQSTTPTPAVDNKASSVTPGLRNNSDITSQPRVDEVNDSDGKSSVIIIAGSSAGGVLVLLVIIVAMCKCRKSTRKDGQAECPSVNDSVNQHDVEYDSYGLKDNILYVSADEQLDTENANDPQNKKKTSSTYEGNYSTVDIDQPRNSDDDCAGAYCTVDLEEKDEKQYYNVPLQKPKPMLKPKPSTQKEQPTTTEKNNEMDKSNSNLEYPVVNTRNVKAEYAVVDKTKRIDDGVEHFSVKGTGDEYAMVNKQ